MNKLLFSYMMFYTVFASTAQANIDSVIYYKPVFVNQCTGEIVNDNYAIREINEFLVLSKKTSDNQLLILPAFGSYLLITQSSGEYEFEINHLGLNVDTFFVSRLYQRYFYRYEFCGEIANGRIECHFPNGELNTIGNFKSGELIDSVKYYHASGNVKEIRIRKSIDTIQILRFYKNGNLRVIFNYESPKLIRYYGNGILKEKVDSKNRKWYINGYYPNGKIENNSNNGKEQFFYENGHLKEELVYKEIWSNFFIRHINPRENGFFSDRYYKIKWKNFNENGIINRKIIFTHRLLFLNSNKKVENLNFEFVKSITFYQTGKKYKIIEYAKNDKVHILYEYIQGKKIFVKKIKGNKEILNHIERIEQEINL